MEFPVRIVSDGTINWFELIVQISTIVTAVIAIFISIITYRSQVAHNKNSVRPILNVSCGDYVGSIFVKIKNKGVGPATILSVSCNSSEPNKKRSKCSLIAYFDDLAFLWTTFAGDISGYTIAPDNEIVLLEANSTDEVELHEIRKRLKDIEIVVEYEDIYKDKMNPATRKLDWFGRTLKR